MVRKSTLFNAQNIIHVYIIALTITKSQVSASGVHNNDTETPLASSLKFIRPRRNNEPTEQKPKTLKLTNEKRLIKDLLDNYQVKWGRPVNNMSEKVVVYFGINLVQLLDMDEKNQVLITNVYALYKWTDTGLRWDKNDYGGLDSIRLPVNRIWTPDIVLYNYADTRLEEKREALAVVQDDGTVRWRPPSILKSTCQIDIVKFPYDIQRCSMKFGSWTYDGDSIDIQFYDNRTEISRDEYITSNEWDIIEAPAVRNEKFYSCCKEPYPDLTFYLMIKRRGGFYNYILVLPCVLLSCLTMVLFWLPPESPAKMVLGMNIFTSFFVLLLLLSKNVPSATDRIPLIGGYYCLNMVMIATSTCCCTVVVHIFFRGTGKIPFLIRKIFLEFLAKLFCMVPPATLPAPQTVVAKKEAQVPLLQQQPGQVTITTSQCIENGLISHQINRDSDNCPSFKQDEASPLKSSQINNETKLSSKLNTAQLSQSSTNFNSSLLNSSLNQHAISYHNNLQNNQTQQQQMNNELNLTLNLIENDIKEIRDYLRHTRKKLENTDAKAKQTNEWKQVALVLDRALFYCYCIAIVVSLALMFPR